MNKYLHHYNIKISDYSQAKLFFRFEPLALRLFCEVKRDKIVTLSQETLFDVFDQYISDANSRVVEKLEMDAMYNKNFLIKGLSLISQYMWDNNVSRIQLSENVGVNKKELYAICNEDLLIYRDWYEEENMGFTYDLMGGYLIAKYLIKQFDSFDKFATAFSGELKKRLLDCNSQSVNPLYDDITYCLMVLALQKFQFSELTLLPSELKSYLVKAIFTSSIESVHNQGSTILDFLSHALTTNYENMRVAHCCAFIPNHQLNFDFTSDILKKMKVAQRDIIWTAYKSTSEIDENLSVIKQFADICNGNTERKNNVHIVAKYVMWLLASNSHKLRYEATKALYYYGRSYPQCFITLLVYSLDINDVYVPERMLAVSYGLSLNLQSGNFENLTIKNFLIPIARIIYDKLYSENAVLITTHSLIRNYARKTIKLANKLSPGDFSIEELNRIERKCNITKQNISHWQTVKECGGPLQMDFSNYTLGTLIPDGSSYSNPKLKQQSRGYIYKRIYELGWDEKLFKNIESTNRHYNNTREDGDNGIDKMDRFGKKYSWIAFYELAGILSDNGLLDVEYKYWTEVNPDIDPTFPTIEPERNIEFDHLLHNEWNLQTWFNNDIEENFSNLYYRYSLNNDNADYICLYGYFSDKDRDSDKSRFNYIRPFICKSDDINKLSEYLWMKDLSGGRLMDVIKNGNCFVGEMFVWPDSTYSNWEDMEFKRDAFAVIHEENQHLHSAEVNLLKFNVLLSEQEKTSLLDEIEKDLSFDANDIEVIKVLIPTMDYYMEYDGSIGTQSTLAKEIVFSEELNWIPQTFNLNDHDGNKITSIIHKSRKDSYYEFVYLRKDILDNFLNKNKYSMLFCVWGQRENIQNNIKGKGFKHIEIYSRNLKDQSDRR